MPTIPFDPTVMTVTPSDQPLRGFDINATPAKFGEQKAQAIEQAGNTTLDAAIHFQGLKNETDAKHADIQANNAWLQQYGDYMKLQGKDAVDGYQDAYTKMNSTFDQVRATLPSDEARRMYDASALRSLRSFQMTAASHAAQQNKLWMTQESEDRIQNQIQIGSTFYNDDDKFKTSVATIRDETIQRSELMGLGPEATQHAVEHYTSEAWMARVRSTMPNDLEKARDLFEQNKGQIDAPHQAAIEETLRNHEYTSIMRENAQWAKEDREAEKTLRTAQTTNNADITADFIKTHKAMDSDALAKMVSTQQISVEQYHGYLSLVSRKEPTEGNKNVLIDLMKKYNDGTLTDDMITQNAGSLTDGQITSFMSRVGREETQGFKENYQLLREALQAHALENGFIKDPDQAATQSLLWMRADAEFHDRVLRGNEAPRDVVQDMVPRYNQMIHAPNSWPTPRAGPVNNVRDVMNAFKATDSMHSKGQITDSQFDYETQLLHNYLGIYQTKERNAALKAPKAAAGSKTEKGAEVVGVTGGE